MKHIVWMLAPLALAAALAQRSSTPPSTQVPPPCSEGTLAITDPYGKATGELCPLKHTGVHAEISGFLARVTVTQDFENTHKDKIEAVYVFPLPEMAAVDDMTMKVGERVIKAQIKERDEARKIYEQARQQGHVASLLEQDRPNIFRQSVTNIEPGAKVRVTISYVETLKYDSGSYEWSFPMTVGPRYIPAHTPQDINLNPKYAPPETRAGHDLSLDVALDAGVPLDSLRSKTHDIDVQRPSTSRAAVRLKDKAVIPNKDFVLRYDVAGATVQDAVLTHRASRGGFFTLILQPPQRVTQEDVAPKELVFVLDTSGSMSGFPIEKAKETMKLALDGLYPRDTFNLITFSGDTHVLFPQPVPATRENLAAAQSFLAGRRGGGGTEMMKAIRAALAPSGERDKVRIVCFMTDGYVGNDFEIIGEVKKHPEARVFSFGIGSSVNRFLLDKMAEEGRGEVEYVGLNEDGSAAARRFHERIRNPLLTDVTVAWGGLPVADVYPARIPDLFSAKPVIVHGRYTGPANGVIRLRGRMSGKPWSREIRVNLPASQPEHDTLATLWARARVEDLMGRDWAAHQSGNVPADIQNEITRLGLEYRLMTQFTAFVAVEEKTVTRDGKPVRVDVPVEMPEGVSHEGVFGPGGSAEAVRLNATGRGGGFSAFKASKATPAVAVYSESIRIEAAPSQMHDSPTFEKLDATLQRLLATETDHSKKVTVEVWLSDAEPATLDKLKKAGFEDSGHALVAKIRRGQIRLDRLAALEKLAEVTRITLAPAR
jgi:Ca-activated chloride channel family protein